MTMSEEQAVRDGSGRWRPGTSGNPSGLPGRPAARVNELADEAVETVLRADLATVADPEASRQERREALDRLARLGARRITARESVEVDAGLADVVVGIIAASVTDAETLKQIATELEKALP